MTDPNAQPPVDPTQNSRQAPPPPTGAQQPPPYGGQQPYSGQQQPPGQQPYGQQAPPQYSYQGQQAAGAPLTQAEDKQWASFAHFGGAIGAFLGAGMAGWIAPLIIMMVFKDRGPFTRQEAKESLNFQLTVTIFVVGLYILGGILALVLIGFLFFPLAWLVGIIGVIFGIIAGVKVNNGEAYRYFFAIRLVK